MITGMADDEEALAQPGHERTRTRVPGRPHPDRELLDSGNQEQGPRKFDLTGQRDAEIREDELREDELRRASCLAQEEG